ncbi:23S rRNA (pseudouridine(1915)-N(3))-methyltransferase RlmH [Halothiobacillus diazotrophicus]|uniref:Ribosomal RNA large subunit methyltransferase H n=1 Tax=Halothiobacillus diazotrophicus TaxID=1860122 RepID=A0A191ZFC3_9GAMM|nr:23S rRNA (pseudouridine(1915)-N(3))-methyltransferase RlmH [Halothiobacillus diazotrophicus]ANJ66560.1 23S rRNA (pseudouridine(1915)-N(3))-methyltransferase RlmH [Halothiobacillus diazotrophicus]
MKIHLVSVGTRLPNWAESGTNEYLKRMPPACPVQLHEVAAVPRSKSTATERAKAEECARIEAQIPKNAWRIVCDERGKSWSTAALSSQLAEWMQSGRDVAIVVGGADGLTDELRRSADRLWQLSELTLPHPLVRVLLAEQLYRAWSLLNNHPYHRE